MQFLNDAKAPQTYLRTLLHRHRALGVPCISGLMPTCHRQIHGGFARVHEEFARIRKNVRRVRGWVYNGFMDGFATDSREFARVRKSSREFARVRESSREVAKDTRMDSQRMYGGFAD